MFFSNSLSMDYEGKFSMIMSELSHTAEEQEKEKNADKQMVVHTKKVHSMAFPLTTVPLTLTPFLNLCFIHLE